MLWLRHGVLILLGLVGLLVLLALWLWRDLLWQQGFLALDPLSQPVDAPLPAIPAMTVSSATLQTRLLSVLAKPGVRLSLQGDMDRVRMQLEVAQLSVLHGLPAWPGWQLDSLTLTPSQGVWLVTMVWHEAIEGVPKGRLSSLAMTEEIDPSAWLLDGGNERVNGQVGGQVRGKLSDAATRIGGGERLPWRLLGHWRQAEGRGVWVLDGRSLRGHAVALGETLDSWRLLTVDGLETLWQHDSGQVVRQPLCRQLSGCEAIR